MSLSNRLRSQIEQMHVDDRTMSDLVTERRPDDPFVKMKERAQEALVARLGNRLFDESLDQKDLDAMVSRELTAVIGTEQTALTSDERHELIRDIVTDVLGFGPIERYLADPAVTEVMVNSCDRIYVERAGRLHQTMDRFGSEDQLRRVIERIVAPIGRRIDESSPMVDARLPDGSRVNAVIPPLAVDGPSLTIRKFNKRSWTLQDLTGLGAMTPPVAAFLEACVVGKANILVSGGTGSGKTTMLNALSACIPENERLVTIEDAVELKLLQDHVVRLESRPANLEGKGQVTIRDLVRNSLRMRPDRIIVGEVRSGEALDMLQAMNTGHEGSLSTLHANSPRDALARLETMVLMAGMDLPVAAIREQVASAIDVIVQISRLRDGSRRVVKISEVVGQEGDIITLNDLFDFDFAAGVDADGRFLGHIQPSGVRPRFSQRFEEVGIHMTAEMFSRYVAGDGAAPAPSAPVPPAAERTDALTGRIGRQRSVAVR